MAKHLLNKKDIRALKPKDKRYCVADGDGLFLIVEPTGTKRWESRTFRGGKRVRIGLGVYNEADPDALKTPREKHEELRAKARAGQDPRAKLGMTFREMYEDWMEVHKPRGDGRGWSATHAERNRHLGEDYLYPKIGSRMPADLTRQELAELVRSVWQAKPPTAEKLLSALSLALRHGMALGLLDADPSAGIRRAMPPLPPQKHFASLQTPEEAGMLLRVIQAYPHAYAVKAALQFHVWTAARSKEVRLATWAEIDMDQALWTVPAERMKNRREHRVPLPGQCLNMLRELQIMAPGSPYLFPSPRAKGRPISENTVLFALRGMGLDKKQMTTHGFRAMFSTLVNDSGRWNSDLVEAQLAHAGGDAVRRAYNRGDYLERRREMMQWWADWLDGLKAEADAKAAAAVSALPTPAEQE